MLFAKNKKQKTRKKDSPHFHVARPRRRPSGPPYLHSVYRPSCMAPVIWSQVPETTLSPRQLERLYVKRCPYSWPYYMIIHNPFWIIKCTDIPLSLSFLGHSTTFRHTGVTLATPRVVSFRRAKAFTWRKVVSPANVTLPVEVGQLAHPSCLAPRGGFPMWTVGWFCQKNKL